MKKIFTLLMVLTITMTSFASNFSGFVTQTNGESVSIEIISDDGDSTLYQCEEDNAFMGLKKRQSFNINLKKDSHYTLIFTCGNGEDKYVYIDTNSMGCGNTYEILMYEYDTVVYYEPLYNTPRHTSVERSFLEWICENFPLVRDYNTQLEELGEEPVNCD
jgi:hypothetical protein